MIYMMNTVKNKMLKWLTLLAAAVGTVAAVSQRGPPVPVPAPVPVPVLVLVSVPAPVPLTEWLAQTTPPLLAQNGSSLGPPAPDRQCCPPRGW